MSKFSGKCDLYDHICMKAKENETELDAFNKFKKETGGVIYQYIELKLTNFNIDNEIKKVNSEMKLSKIPHTKIVKDKRTKLGEKEVTTYTYIYDGKPYETLNDINRQGYFTKKEIRFNTLLDIIPYYPYIISLSVHSDGKAFIVISDESYIDTTEASAIKHGYSSKMADISRRMLQNHYREIVLNFFNPEGREVEETVKVVNKDDKLIATVSNKIDYNFDLEVKRTLHDYIYASPVILDFDKGLVDVTNVWPNELKEGQEITLKYVKQKNITGN